ncbi:unnamed protein product [Fraxinus pennsylvanica]|uniref:Uncharacterized protein n=1 Tax=Fraxinus pennsylvanica TaxID=56036 RepID=A0AAD1YLN0_9LAMI|nr:unnamed protein product [Fraxinus pennsylvanica]
MPGQTAHAAYLPSHSSHACCCCTIFSYAVSGHVPSPTTTNCNGQSSSYGSTNDGNVGDGVAEAASEIFWSNDVPGKEKLNDYSKDHVTQVHPRGQIDKEVFRLHGCTSRGNISRSNSSRQKVIC